MRALCLAVALAILLGVTGCGSDKNAAQRSKTSSETSAESSQPHAKQVLTADNSKDLAALLKVSDYCDETVARFVDKYRGRTIEFDGSIKNVATHGDYPSTQYDLLVAPGNKGPKSTVGPKFKFEDVGVPNLNLTGSNRPESVGEGDRFRFVARVVDYNPEPQCLLFLKPVSTSVR